MSYLLVDIGEEAPDGKTPCSGCPFDRSIDECSAPLHNGESKVRPVPDAGGQQRSPACLLAVKQAGAMLEHVPAEYRPQTFEEFNNDLRRMGVEVNV